MQIFAIQERQIKSHLLALSRVGDSRKTSVTYLQFSILRPIAASIYKRDFHKTGVEIKRAAKFIYHLCRMPFTKKSIIVLGIAPFDWRLIFMAPFLHRHEVFFHNSWPTWGPQEHSPKSKFLGINVFVWNAIVPRLTKGIFCVSSATAISIHKHFPNWPKCRVVGHTVSETQFLSFPEVDAKKWNKSVCFVGRMVSEKGVEQLVELAQTLPAYKFHFVGDGPLLKHVQSLNLANITCHGFIGSREDLNKVLDQCSIIAQPSRSSEAWTEAFGIGVLEGMARGIIPITTDTAGSLALLGDNLQTFAFRSDEYVQCFKVAVEKLDSTKAAVLRSECLKRSLEFNPDTIAHAWNEFFLEANC